MPTVLDLLAVLLAGVLAGEELAVRWGVQPALVALEDRSHLLARQALIRRLRVVVPALMLPTTAVSIVALAVDGDAAGLLPRAAGTACLVLFLLASFLGTVPINIRVDRWDAGRPPADWRRVIRRWQRIDVLRSSAAAVAFAVLLVGAVLR